MTTDSRSGLRQQQLRLLHRQLPEVIQDNPQLAGWLCKVAPAGPKPSHAGRADQEIDARPDYIVCLEDGKKLKMLKRHLRTAYDLTPEEYRAKWGLPPDYPMVAPNYAAQRSVFAKKIGLGRSPGARRRGRGRR